MKGKLLALIVLLSALVPPVSANGSCWWWNTETCPPESASEESQTAAKTLIDHGLDVPKWIKVCGSCGGKNYTGDGWWVFVYWNLTVTDNLLDPEPEPEPEPQGGCFVDHEDGLYWGIMWDRVNYPHELLVVKLKPKIWTTLYIIIVSDYGFYSRIVHTRARSVCIYYRAERFYGDYSITLLASNALGSYTPDHLLTVEMR